MTEIGESVAVTLVVLEPEKEEEKDYEVEWSREHVIPHNILKTGEIEAGLTLKNIKGSVTGPDASVSIVSADSGPALTGGYLPGLK
jgi:hypothetical protein